MDKYNVEDHLKKFQIQKCPQHVDEKILHAAREHIQTKQARVHPFWTWIERTSRVAVIAASILLIYYFSVQSPTKQPPAESHNTMNKIDQRNTEARQVFKEWKKEFDADPSTSALVVNTLGKVKYDNNQTTSLVTSTVKVKNNDKVSTGYDGRAYLVLRDGSIFKMASNTQVSIKLENRSRYCELTRGKLWALVTPSGRSTFDPLFIKTPASDVHVVGTELVIKATDSMSHLAISHGGAYIGNNNTGFTPIPDRYQALAMAKDKSVKVARLVNEKQVFKWARLFSSKKQHPVEKPLLDDDVVSCDGQGLGSLHAKTQDGELPMSLVSHKVYVDIKNNLATTTVEQIFFNSTNRRLEGTLRFPLPKDASISRFDMTVTNNELMRGSIVERDRARKIYESIVRRMEDPGLLEWEEGNIFKTRIFPIEPNSTKTIVIAYTQTMTGRNGQASYIYPMVSESSNDTPPESFSLELNMESGLKISNPDSPSHNLNISRKDNYNIRASLAAGKYLPQNDFVFNFELEQGNEIQVLKQPHVSTGYYLIRFRPEFKEEENKKQDKKYLFLVDDSASINASLREIQYNLLTALLDTLTEKEKFHVAMFNTSVEFLTPDFASPTKDEKEKLMQTLWGRKGIGATDFEATFKELGKKFEKEQDLTIVYIGDGIPTFGEKGTAELLNIWKESLGKCVGSFFALGLGNSINSIFLDGIATSQGGKVEALIPGENLIKRAQDLSSLWKKPLLKEIQVTIDGVDAKDIYPKSFTNLALGEELTILGIYTTEGKITLNVNGKIAAKAYSFKKEIDLSKDTSESKLVGRLWAQRKLVELLKNNTGGKNKEEIIKLSEKFSIMTPYTSFLVLESEEEYKKYHIERTKDEKEIKEKGPSTVYNRNGDSTNIPGPKPNDPTGPWTGDDGVRWSDLPFQPSNQGGLKGEFGLQGNWQGDFYELKKLAEYENMDKEKEGWLSDGREINRISELDLEEKKVTGGIKLGEVPLEWRERLNLYFDRLKDAKVIPKEPAPVQNGKGYYGYRSYRPLPESLQSLVTLLSAMDYKFPLDESKLYNRAQTLASLVDWIEKARALYIQKTAYDILATLISQEMKEAKIATTWYKQNIEALDTMIRYNPHDLENYVRLGIAYEATGIDPIKAISTMVEVRSEEYSSHIRLAQIFVDKKNIQRAIEQYLEATRLRSEESFPYIQVAKLYMAEGKYDQAEKYLGCLLKYNFLNNPSEEAKKMLLETYESWMKKNDSKKGAIQEKIEKLKANKLFFKDVRIVLEWNTSGTDLDLHITAPAEEKCFYSQKTTHRGGQLDRDITSGYGPETYTLPDMRKGKFLIEVNYFGGNAKTTGNVTIIIYEGTDKEVKKVVPFQVSNSKETVKIFEGELSELK